MDGNSKTQIARIARRVAALTLSWLIGLHSGLFSSGLFSSGLLGGIASAQDVALERDTASQQNAASQGVAAGSDEGGATRVAPKRLMGAALAQHIKAQLLMLDSPSFRERQLARYRIEQYPYSAIVAIVAAAPKASIDAAVQQISLLDTFSTNPDIAISSAAYDVLKQFSLIKGTALAALAEKSIRAIENANEMKAFEILTHLGANIGHLDLSINGAQSDGISANVISLEIKTDAYRGDDQSLTWIRYLRSVEVVSVSGPIVSADLLSLVAQMPNVKKVLIEDATLQPKELLPLKSIAELQHLELTYMPVTDEFVPVLCQLPLTQSLRLYGTGVTTRGEAELARKLEGLEIYRSDGGFLGIASPATGEVQVTKVVPGSAAAKAGIRLNDRITEIEDKPIKNFTALRATLADFAPDEPVQVKVVRQVIDPKTMRLVPTEMVLTVMLGKQEKN